LKSFHGQRFSRVLPRVSIIGLLLTCIGTPSEDRQHENEIHLRYKIIPGMLLLLFEILIKDYPRWLIDIPAYREFIGSNSVEI
jgi:hypothetical protein